MYFIFNLISFISCEAITNNQELKDAIDKTSSYGEKEPANMEQIIKYLDILKEGNKEDLEKLSKDEDFNNFLKEIAENEKYLNDVINHPEIQEIEKKLQKESEDAKKAKENDL